jgi:hypothetical protein
MRRLGGIAMADNYRMHRLGKAFIDAAIDRGQPDIQPWQTMTTAKRGELIYCLLAVLTEYDKIVAKENEQMRKALELCRGASLAPWQRREVEEALG